MLRPKFRTAIAIIAAAGGVAAVPSVGYAMTIRAPVGTNLAAGSLSPGGGGGSGQPTNGTSTRYVTGTGNPACQAATNAANSWQSAVTQADLAGDYEEAKKDYNYADTIAGQANAGPNDCVIYDA